MRVYSMTVIIGLGIAQLVFGQEVEQAKTTVSAFQDLYDHPNKGKEAFKLRWEDLSLSFNLLGQIQVAPYVQNSALVENDDPATTEGFRIRRARIGMHGLYKDILGINLVIDLRDQEGGSNTISVANIVYRPYPFLNISLGTAPLPFSRASITSSTKLQMIERPLSATKITPGSQLGGSIMGSVFGGRFAYAVGVYNGEEGRFTKGDLGKGMLYAGRIQISPLGSLDPAESDIECSPFRFSIGGDYFYNNNASIETHAVSGDVAMKWKGASLSGEVIWDRRTPSTQPVLPTSLPSTVERLGWYVQGGYFVIPRMIEIAARFEWLDDQRDISDAGDIWLLTGGVNIFMFNNYLKAQLNYTHKQERKVKEILNDVLFAQFQVNL